MALVRFPDPLTWNLGSKLGYSYSGNITFDPKYWQHYVQSQILATICATLGCLLNGSVIGYTGPAIPR